jgi:hypothetical protein
MEFPWLLDRAPRLFAVSGCLLIDLVSVGRILAQLGIIGVVVSIKDPEHSRSSGWRVGLRAGIELLSALERLVVEKGLTDREVMRERKRWTEAYLHTAHGKPVELNGSDRERKHS